MLKYPIVNSIVNPEMDSEGLIKEYVIKKEKEVYSLKTSY